MEDKIKRIEKCIESLDVSGFKWDEWKPASLATLSVIFGDDSECKKQLRMIEGEIKYANGNSYFDPEVEKCKSQSRAILNGCIDDLNAGLCFEKRGDKDGHSITMTQNQSVNLDIVLLSLKDEFGNRGMDELGEMIDSEKTSEGKKGKINEFLKKHGDTAGILGNIIAKSFGIGVGGE